MHACICCQLSLWNLSLFCANTFVTPRLPAVSKNNNYKGSIYMAFDYADYDLTGLMETVKYKFSEAQVKGASYRD